MTANSCYVVSTLQIARVKLNKANGGGERWWPGRNEFFSSSFKGSACGPSKGYNELNYANLVGLREGQAFVWWLKIFRRLVYIANHDRRNPF